MAYIPSNINALVENITSTGLAYSNRYEVLINYPKIYPNQSPYDAQRLAIRCDAVTVPGRSFSTTPYRFYGPARNMPYEPIYSGELNLSVILSEDLRERAFFETWMDMINSRLNYKFSFYEDYISTLIVNVINKSDAITHRFIIEEAYPKTIGDLQMGYDKDNEFMRQDVTISYRKYTPEYIGIPAPAEEVGPPSPQRSMSFVNNGGRVSRVGNDGTVDGFYDPQTAFTLLNGGRIAPPDQR